jgi:hypothetical protein
MPVRHNACQYVRHYVRQYNVSHYTCVDLVFLKLEGMTLLSIILPKISILYDNYSLYYYFM